ncbi:MAG: hypothetical protein JWR90_3594 [Marmoricola sp.]|jgi:hypothetical protein|nr:hypothetical protein [Marmoricola sp.]
MPALRRSAQLGTLLAVLLLAAGCGTTEPAPLKATKPEVPADLCATVPEAARTGLLANANTDTTGNPTAACSLRSADGAKTKVQAVVTWLQANDDTDGEAVWDSQCQAIDLREFRAQSGFQAKGADKSCAATSRTAGADGATLAAVAGREIVTVRLTTSPAGTPTSISRGQQMLEGVLASLAGDS